MLVTSPISKIQIAKFKKLKLIYRCSCLALHLRMTAHQNCHLQESISLLKVVIQQGRDLHPHLLLCKNCSQCKAQQKLLSLRRNLLPGRPMQMLKLARLVVLLCLLISLEVQIEELIIVRFKVSRVKLGVLHLLGLINHLLA